MCGICGIVSGPINMPVDANMLRTLADSMIHRGPDSDGFYITDKAGLGARRLAIIDLSPNGNQPFSNEDGSVWVVFNGEIYNFQALRKELVTKGHRFRSQTDTEVIVHLYEEMGAGCVNKLDGMFSFAIWDTAKRQLMLARDRFGIKPVYYAIVGGQLFFASEINALLKIKTIPKELDYEAVSDYFSLYYIPAPKTIFKHIRKLPAAQYMLWKDGQLAFTVYWRLSYLKDAAVVNTENEWIEKINVLLEDAIRRELVSDVPVGVFLSGGLDSTVIAALSSKFAGCTLKTFTIKFNHPDFDESVEAAFLARRYGLDHHEWFVDENVISDFLPKSITSIGQPIGDWTSALQYYLCQHSKKHVTVALSGTGGDEVFAGYPTLTADKFIQIYNRLPFWVRQVINFSAHKLPVSMGNVSFDFIAKKISESSRLNPYQAHFFWKEIFTETEKKLLLSSHVVSEIGQYNSFDFWVRCNEYLEPETNVIDRLLNYDMKVFLEGCLLSYNDAVSMANSQEVRVPYLDSRLVEFAATIPVSLKHRFITTKYVFRKAVKHLLPADIVKKKKMGFVPPTSSWIQGKLREFVTDMLNTSKFINCGLFNRDFVLKIVDEHMAGRKDNGRKIAALTSFAIWIDQCLS